MAADNLHETSRTYLYYHTTRPDTVETDGLLEPAPTSPDNNATHPDATEADNLLEPAPASSDDNTHYGKTGETLCHVYLPVYSYVDSYTQFGYYLTAQGADVTVNEDGSGFSVRFQGNVSQWGDKPAVDFDELENWY